MRRHRLVIDPAKPEQCEKSTPPTHEIIREIHRQIICDTTLDEWLHVYRRNQLDFVPELLGLSAPMVSAPAGLHCHHAGRLRGEKIEHFPAAQLFAECDGSVCPRTMHLEAVLRQIDPDDASLIHGCLFLSRGIDAIATLARFDAVGRGRPIHRVWTSMDAPGDASSSLIGSVHAVRCCRLFGLLVRPVGRRWPVWRYAERVQIVYGRPR